MLSCLGSPSSEVSVVSVDCSYFIASVAASARTVDIAAAPSAGSEASLTIINSVANLTRSSSLTASLYVWDPEVNQSRCYRLNGSSSVDSLLYPRASYF